MFPVGTSINASTPKCGACRKWFSPCTYNAIPSPSFTNIKPARGGFFTRISSAPVRFFRVVMCCGSGIFLANLFFPGAKSVELLIGTVQITKGSRNVYKTLNGVPPASRGSRYGRYF